MTAISRRSQLALARSLCADNKLAGAHFWAMVTRDRELVPVLLPVGPGQQRDVDLLILQHLTKRLAVVRAFQLMEAWVTVHERHAGETEAEHRARSIAVPPRESETRREAINLLDVRKGKPPVQVLQFIERDARGRPYFPDEPIVQRGDGLESGWALVLDEPPPLPPGPAGDRLRTWIDKALVEITLNDARVP